jgi:hypothetical protein
MEGASAGGGIEMTQISAYTTAPYQGVSQAPPQTRLPEQASALDNCFVPIPQGCGKRPPFTWLGILGSHPGLTNGAFHRVERAGNTDAIVTLTQESGVTVPRLYLLTNFPAIGAVSPEALTVSGPAQAYLSTGNPTVADLALLTVEDFTFITNRKKTVAKVAGHQASRNPECMIWLRETAYGRVFSVTVSPVGGTPVTAQLRTVDGTDASDSNWIDNTLMVGVLAYGNAYATSNGASHSGSLSNLTSQGYTVTTIGPIIYITGATDFTVETSDGLGGGALTAIKDKAQTFSDLPAKAVNGFTVRLTQQSSTDKDDFFVTYNETAGPGTGIWEETLAPGAELGLDPATMPVGVVYNSGWQINVLGWTGRTTGNETLDPDPAFVGGVVQDLSYYRGRLAVISEDAVTLSDAEDNFRMYPRTLASVLDSDPVGLVSPFPSRSTLRYGATFDTKLVVFGDLFQAVVQADGVVTPGTVRIDVLTTYEFSPLARPYNSNGKIYFVAPHGTQWGTLYEMKTDRTTNITQAEDMTLSVPRYLPVGANLVATCPVNYLAAYGVSGANDFLIHLYRYADLQRVQNAWMKWILPEGYLLGGMFFYNTELYVLACKGGVTHLLMANTAPGILDPHTSSRMLTMLDMRVDETQVGRSYNATTNLTTVTLPYPTAATSRATIRAPGITNYAEGYLVPVVSYAGSTLTLEGDWTSAPMWFGHSYTSTHTFSKLYAVGKDNQPLRSGRLSIRKVACDVSGTGYLRAEVTPRGRTTYKYTFSGFIADDPSSEYDRAPVAEGVFSFPVMSENEQVEISLVNDSHFAHALLGFEWVATLNLKAQRAQ